MFYLMTSDTSESNYSKLGEFRVVGKNKFGSSIRQLVVPEKEIDGIYAAPISEGSACLFVKLKDGRRGYVDWIDTTPFGE